MGYYTRYYLAVQGMKSQADYDKVTNWLESNEITPSILYEDRYNEKYNTQYYYCNDEAKWYEYDEDMQKLSKEFPTFTFMLHGDGEDDDDRWDAYYNNGFNEFCRVEIHYPEPKIIIWNELASFNGSDASD